MFVDGVSATWPRPMNVRCNYPATGNKLSAQFSGEGLVWWEENVSK